MEITKNEVQEPEENLDAEAIKAEEEALKGIPEESIRSQVIEKYGLDPDINPELIDSLVKDKIEENKRLSTAIKQKISWREKSKSQSSQKVKEETPQQQPSIVNEDLILQKVDEKLEQKELDSIDVSDDIKKEVKSYAKLNKVSIKEALSSPYISFLKNEADKKARIESASISSTHKIQSKQNFSELTPADFDLTSKEGREQWDEYKKWLKTS